MRRIGEFIDHWTSSILTGCIIALVIVLAIMLIPIPKGRRRR